MASENSYNSPTTTVGVVTILADYPDAGKSIRLSMRAGKEVEAWSDLIVAKISFVFYDILFAVYFPVCRIDIRSTTRLGRKGCDRV